MCGHCGERCCCWGGWWWWWLMTPNRSTDNRTEPNRKVSYNLMDTTAARQELNEQEHCYRHQLHTCRRHLHQQQQPQKMPPLMMATSHIFQQRKVWMKEAAFSCSLCVCTLYNRFNFRLSFFFLLYNAGHLEEKECKFAGTLVQHRQCLCCGLLLPLQVWKSATLLCAFHRRLHQRTQ